MDVSSPSGLRAQGWTQGNEKGHSDVSTGSRNGGAQSFSNFHQRLLVKLLENEEQVRSTKCPDCTDPVLLTGKGSL